MGDLIDVFFQWIYHKYLRELEGFGNNELNELSNKLNELEDLIRQDQIKKDAEDYANGIDSIFDSLIEWLNDKYLQHLEGFDDGELKKCKNGMLELYTEILREQVLNQGEDK